MVEPELFSNQNRDKGPDQGPNKVLNQGYLDNHSVPLHQHPKNAQNDYGIADLKIRLNETAARLAVLEERATNLRKNGQNTDESLLEYSRETRADVKALRERLTELARIVEDVQQKIDAMAGELENLVKRPDFAVLEHYLDLWQPLNFITREEAKMLLKDAKFKNSKFEDAQRAANK